MGIFTLQVQRRLSDLDFFGHVNNVMYAAYLQEARVKMLADLGQESFATFSQVLARVEIDYRKPLLYSMEPITINIWITKVGRTSYSFAAQMLDDDGSVAADAAGVMVCFDTESGQARPIPDRLRTSLEASLES